MFNAMGYIVMGVSGCGKSHLGAAFAEQLNCPFIEGDAFHPQTNIDKMSAGEPLTDEDRLPWLYALADAATEQWAQSPNWVMSCSALKPSYRDIFRALDNPVRFVFLNVPADVLLERLQQRDSHFMPASLLDSQLLTLHWRENETDVIRLDGQASISELVAQCVAQSPAPFQNRGTFS